MVNPTDTPVVIPKGSLIGKFVCASAADTLIPFGQCPESAECTNQGINLTLPAANNVQGSEVPCQSKVASVTGLRPECSGFDTASPAEAPAETTGCPIKSTDYVPATKGKLGENHSGLGISRCY